jgi:hypothetical protein
MYHHSARSVEEMEKAEMDDEKKLEEGSKPKQLTKHQSADISEGDYHVLEGLVTPNLPIQPPVLIAGTVPNTYMNAEDDPRFPDFYRTLGDEMSFNMEEMNRQFAAWKVYSRIEKNPVQLRTMIAKLLAVNLDRPSASKLTSSKTEIQCSYCKKEGHHISECQSKPQRPVQTMQNQPGKPAVSASKPIVCFRCNKEGHISRNCTEFLKENQAGNSKPTTGEKEASAKAAKTGDSDVITMYMIKASSKDEKPATPVVEIPRKRKGEPESAAGKQPEVKKKTRTKVRLPAT